MKNIAWSNYKEFVNPSYVEITFNDTTEYCGKVIRINKYPTPKFYQMILQLLDNSDSRLNVILLQMAENLKTNKSK